jgi:hypothetical protein
MVHMTKYVNVVQSNYVPWKGDFGLIVAVDDFVMYGQYTRHEWYNRNPIHTSQGVQ